MASGDLEAWLQEEKFQARKAKHTRLDICCPSPPYNGKELMVCYKSKFLLFCLVFVTFGSLLMYLILTHEQVTWFDKCVEKLHFKVHGLHEVCVSYVYLKHKL